MPKGRWFVWTDCEDEGDATPVALDHGIDRPEEAACRWAEENWYYHNLWEYESPFELNVRGPDGEASRVGVEVSVRPEFAAIVLDGPAKNTVEG
jgi:hypothetical protein